MDLSRFHDAQSDPDQGYECALRELRSGAKQSHWIWYIFPQLDGLGGSSQSTYYAIADIVEAAAYLKDPVLGPRLLTISRAVLDKVRSGVSLLELMNSSIDVQKLVSSMTLFGGVAERVASRGGRDVLNQLSEIAREIRNAAAGEGFPPCRHTGEVLAATPSRGGQRGRENVDTKRRRK